MDVRKNKTVQVKKEVHEKVAIFCIKSKKKINIGNFFSEAALEKIKKNGD